MTRRTIVAVVVLLVILAAIFFWQRNKQDEATVTAILSTTAFNQTQNQDATSVAANKNDTVVYSLNVENPEDEVISGYVVETSISDLQELATLIDAEGANYNPTTGSLIWTPIDIPAKGSVQKKLTVRVKDQLPAGSDLMMTVRFGNEARVAINPSQVAGAATPPPSSGNSAGGSPGSGSTGGSTQGASFQSPQSGPSGLISILSALIATGSVFIYRFKHKLV